MTKRIYLSGPMSGQPDHGYPVFHAHAAQLRTAGHEVVSPAEIDHQGASWEGCLRNDLRAMCDCDTIALIPGWEGSKGVHLELHIAHRLGMEIIQLSAL